MGMVDWVKNKLAAIALATSSVEKTALGQGGGNELGSTSKHQRHRQGSLADALNQGEVTQEVQELRWRMYKVLEQSQKFKTEVVGYDEDGFMMTEQTLIEEGNLGKNTLSKIKMDDTEYSETDEAIADGYEYYPLELLVNNDIITMSLSDVLVDEKEKPERVLKCEREFRPKFDIEDYTKKMHVRTISDTEKLLEFYVTKYADEDNRKSRFFLSEIKKSIKNPRMTDFLDITNVMFISYNTVGVKDLMEFDYKISSFDKIVEFDGYYIIKFKAEVLKNGESIYEKFRDSDLDERYKNKEKRKERD